MSVRRQAVPGSLSRSRIEDQGIYNLGGDLASFAQFILSHDHDGLLRYATLCIDDIFARIRNYNSPITTVSLVQGDALGGGFEQRSRATS